MGKYFHIEDGKAHDFHFYQQKGAGAGLWWRFYIGEIFIGQISKHSKRGYIPINWANPFPFTPRPFVTRLDAAIFMLDWRRYKLKEISDE